MLVFEFCLFVCVYVRMYLVFFMDDMSATAMMKEERWADINRFCFMWYWVVLVHFLLHFLLGFITLSCLAILLSTGAIPPHRRELEHA